MIEASIGTEFDAVARLEGEVRELIRRRGLDPLREPGRVEHLIGEVIADYDERAVRGAVPTLADPDSARAAVRDAVAGFGPLQRYLDDPEIEEIWVNSPGEVFVARRGVSELTTTQLTAGEVRDLVELMLRTSGRRLDMSSPFVDASLPSGARVHAVIPPVTRAHWAVNVRKYLARPSHVHDLVALGTLTTQVAEFLHAAVVAGLNILVAGATQAGKTTMLGALAGSIPQRERVVSCEEVFELTLPARDWVAMQCRPAGLEGFGEITLRQLVKESLRMRPSRLIIGEVREAEAFDLLVALNAGIPGMATVHANSAHLALTKMVTLPLMAGPNVTDRFVVPTVAGAIDLVLYLALDPDGVRRVREVLAVPGDVAEGVVVTTPIFTASRPGGRLEHAGGYPPHRDRFERCGFDLSALLGSGARWAL